MGKNKIKEKVTKSNKNNNYLFFGVLGGLTFTVADWLVFYVNDTTPASQKFNILTKGTAEVAPWRFNLSMILSFISVILLGIGLFSIETYIPNSKHKNIFHYLNVVNLTGWSTLHLFLCVVFYTYYYLMNEGFQEAAVQICEAIGSQYIWIVPVCYFCMFPFFLYYLWLVASGRTHLSRILALSNVMVISYTLAGIVYLLPKNFLTVGLSGSKGNLSLLIHFIILYIYSCMTSTPKKLHVKSK